MRSLVLIFLAFLSPLAFGGEFNLPDCEADLLPVINELSVTIAGTFGLHSDKGSLLLLKRNDGMHWRSEFGRETLAVQGDPRRFIYMTGKDTAKFFGYEMFDGTFMTIPTLERFNWTLRRIAELRPGEGFRELFYKAEGVETPGDFLRNFAETGKLPMATRHEGSLDDIGAIIHDNSFHTGIVFLPPEALNLAQRQIAAIEEFRVFLKARDPELASRAELVSYFNTLHKRFAKVVDIGTGDFVSYLGSVHGANYPAVYKFGYKVLTSEGRSPKDVLRSIYSGHAFSFQVNNRALDSVFWMGYTELRGKFNEHLEQFIESKRSDPSFSQGLAMNESEFTRAVMTRMASIQTAMLLNTAHEARLERELRKKQSKHQ